MFGRAIKILIKFLTQNDIKRAYKYIRSFFIITINAYRRINKTIIVECSKIGLVDVVESKRTLLLQFFREKTKHDYYSTK